MDIPRETQSTNRAHLLDGHNYISFASSSFTCENISCISGNKENTYDFDEEIDM